MIVFGAAGYVGTLLRHGLNDSQVVPVVKNRAQQEVVSGSLVADVRRPGELVRLSREVGPCDSVIYTVGHCPPGGFDEENGTPLSKLETSFFQAHYERLVFGLQNVFRETWKNLLSGGSFIVIGSAITRLTNETCPPWLHVGDYASAQSAQAELVRWMRRDPAVRAESLNVHRLAVGSIEGSPFFDDTTHQPSAFVPTSSLISQVARLIEATRSEDLELLPEPPTNQLSLIQP